MSKEEIDAIRKEVRAKIRFVDNETLLELLGVFNREKERRVKAGKLVN